MKIGVRLALAAYIGFFMYSLLVFFWGPSGVVSLRQLGAHSNELVANIEALKTIRAELQSTVDSLRHDTDEVRLMGRKLGYYEEDQIRIIIEGTPKRNTSHTLGRVLRKVPDTRPNLTVFRAIGFSVALLCSIFILLFGMKPRGNTLR